MRLATKIITSSLLVIVLLTSVAGYFSVRNKYHEFELAQRKLAQATATAIRQELTRAWQDQGLTGVAIFLEEASVASRGALKIRWVSLDPQALPQDRPRFSLADVSVPFGETLSLVQTNEHGQRFLYTYVPVQLPLNRPGALEFAESLTPLEQRMWRDVLLTLGWIGAVAMASIATAYFTGMSWVARPLERLIDKTERIGSGDFSAPLALSNRDELGELAQALNKMCVQLEGQKIQIASAAEQRVAVLDQLRHADRLKTVGRLAAGVGHELGTPLNVISGRAGLIAGGKLTDTEIQSSAQIIKDETERVTTIVRQLMDFARRRHPQRVSCDLAQVISRTIELLQPIAERNSVRLSFEPSGSAQDGHSESVHADAAQLQQVFTNIIVNAIQSMPREGTVRISLTPTTTHNPTDPLAKLTKDYWKISVADEGTGIPEENLSQVFEPFFTTKDVNEGTGLGLSIAYGIVQEHEGWIDVTSQIGQGSQFDVYIPRGPVA